MTSAHPPKSLSEDLSRRTFTCSRLAVHLLNSESGLTVDGIMIYTDCMIRMLYVTVRMYNLRVHICSAPNDTVIVTSEAIIDHDVASAVTYE